MKRPSRNTSWRRWARTASTGCPHPDRPVSAPLSRYPDLGEAPRVLRGAQEAYYDDYAPEYDDYGIRIRECQHVRRRPTAAPLCRARAWGDEYEINGGVPPRLIAEIQQTLQRRAAQCSFRAPQRDCDEYDEFDHRVYRIQRNMERQLRANPQLPRRAPYHTNAHVAYTVK